MKVTNSHQGYGLVTIAIHWVFALIFLGMFGLGFWMVDLTYYDPWYRTGPDLHRSFGVVLFALWICRLWWKATNPKPAPLAGHQAWEVVLANIVHKLLYLLPLALFISGYLISTADGRSISVFGLFDIPSVTGVQKGMEEIAGDLHRYIAYGAIALVGLHALGAIKHHIIDKDRTLLRILKTPQS